MLSGAVTLPACLLTWTMRTFIQIKGVVHRSAQDLDNATYLEAS